MRRKTSGGTGSSARTVVLLILAVVAWVFAGPSQFGGPATYLITDGTSMQPRFHSGDLAVIRKANAYNVGDIIGYRLTAHSIVLHRIVGRDGARLIMKGDNNSWRDATHPELSQVAGSLWIHIPGVGRVLEWLHAPSTIAALVAIAGMAMVLGKNEGPRNGRRDGGRKMNNEAGFSRRSGLPPAGDMLAIAATALLGALVLAFVSFGRPLNRAGTTGASYQQSGTFSYSSLAPGDVYAGNRVSSGDPVFLALVRNLDVQFDYQFASNSARDIHGTYALAVELSQESGWTRTIDLLPQTAFNGTHAEMSSSLSLQSVQALTAAFSSQTGIKGSTFSLALTPVVHVQGTVAGGRLDEVYSPRLPLRMDPYQLAIDHTSDTGDVLHPSATGVVYRPKLETNTFSLAGRSISVGFVRVVALFILGTALAAIAVLAPPTLAAVGADEPTRIQARYGAMLLHISGQPTATSSGRALEVLQFEDLARVAEQQGRMILHSRIGRRNDYVVGDSELLYHYATEARALPRTSEKGVRIDAA